MSEEHQQLEKEPLENRRAAEMDQMKEYFNMKKNLNQLEHENFYEKLMALKAEQEEHIKLVESVYLKELQNNKSSAKTKQNRRPKSILKHTLKNL